MKRRRSEVFLAMSALAFLFLVPAMVLGQARPTLDFATLLPSRDPDTMIGGLKDEMQQRVKDRWDQLVRRDSQIAFERNKGGVAFYPNPSLQAYVNRLGQSLIPKETSENIFVTFKIIEDPLPYAESLATGTIYLSSGMISLLENESQLSFLLMHEAGHVLLSHHLHQFIEEEKEAKRLQRMRMIGAAVGAVAGGVIGRDKESVLKGTAAGLVAAEIDSSVRTHRFWKQIQFESDQFALQVLLEKGFDAREAPALMAKVGEIVRRSGAAVALAFGYAGDLPERSDKVKELLGGAYQPLVTRILDGDGFRMSSPRYSQLMAELKRDNGVLALQRDLFIIARTNLEEAAAVRTDDPYTMYGLGMLFRTVGRSDEDVARAASYLKAAMEFDEIRHRFPDAYLQYAVELLSREDPQRYPEIQKALKSYVVLHQRNNGGDLPREMQFVYDYLDLTGDRGWIAYGVENVSSEVPYQLTGDPKIDRTGQTSEKQSSKK